MDYERIYRELIADRRANPPSEDEYVEVHHILPRCLGGGNEPENLIRLRPEDHFFAHLLLAKVHGGRLWAAVQLMAGTLRSERHTKAANARKARLRYGKYIKLARAQQRGANHPTSDKTSYHWENVDGRVFDGTRYEFRDALHIDNRGVDNVLTGYAKTVNGWFIASLLSEEDANRLRVGGRKPRDESVYLFKHKDGREFHGNRIEFQEEFGVSRQMTDRLIAGGCYTAFGWYLPSMNPDGKDGRYYCSGERNGAAVKTVYHFRHVSGEEFIGTRMALVETYGLNRQAVHNMAKGASATSGGWYMMDGDKPMHADNDNVFAQGCLEFAA